MPQTLEQIRDALAADRPLGDPTSPQALSVRITAAEAAIEQRATKTALSAGLAAKADDTATAEALALRASLDAAGTNADIRRLTGLLTPLSEGQGGTGKTSLADALATTQFFVDQAATYARSCAERFGTVIDGADYFDCTGGDNTTAAFDRLNARLLLAAGRVTVVLPGRIKWPIGPWRITRGGVRVHVTGIVDGSHIVGGHSAYISFGPESNGPLIQTTVTAAIARRQSEVKVASTAGFAPGDWIACTSTEYHSGITDAQGYRRKTKGEIFWIKAVDAGAKILHVEAGTKDAYKVGGETVTLTRLAMLDQCIVDGPGAFIGSGAGGGDLPEEVEGDYDGYSAVRMSRILYPIFAVAKCTNFPRFVLGTEACVQGLSHGTTYLGRDLSRPGNQGVYQSELFNPVNAAGSDGWIHSGNHARNCRRGFDADHSSIDGVPGMIIPRNIIIIGNNTENCHSGMGAHTAENVDFIGNRSVNSGGYFNRGKHTRFIGNVAVDSIGSGFSAGQAGSNAYVDPTHTGRVFAVANLVDGAAENFLSVRADADEVFVSGNQGLRLGGHGVFVRVQIARRIKVLANDFDFAPAAGVLACGLYVQNGGNLRVLGAVDFRLNTVGGATYGAVIEGTASSDSPAGRILANDNTFDNSGEADVLLGALPGGAMGWFAGTSEVLRNAWSEGKPARGWVVIGPPQRFATRPCASASETHRLYNGPAWVGSEIPTNANAAGLTLERGMWAEIAEAGPGVPYRHNVVQTGTLGVLSRTGAMAAGSKILTLDRPGTVAPGMMLTVAGAGADGAPLQSRVRRVDEAVVTLFSAASATVTDAAVAYRPPILAPAFAPAA